MADDNSLASITTWKKQNKAVSEENKIFIIIISKKMSTYEIKHSRFLEVCT